MCHSYETVIRLKKRIWEFNTVNMWLTMAFNLSKLDQNAAVSVVINVTNACLERRWITAAMMTTFTRSSWSFPVLSQCDSRSRCRCIYWSAVNITKACSRLLTEIWRERLFRSSRTPHHYCLAAFPFVLACQLTTWNMLSEGAIQVFVWFFISPNIQG